MSPLARPAAHEELSPEERQRYADQAFLRDATEDAFERLMDVGLDALHRDDRAPISVKKSHSRRHAQASPLELFQGLMFAPRRARTQPAARIALDHPMRPCGAFDGISVPSRDLPQGLSRLSLEALAQELTRSADALFS